MAAVLLIIPVVCQKTKSLNQDRNLGFLKTGSISCSSRQRGEEVEHPLLDLGRGKRGRTRTTSQTRKKRKFQQQRNFCLEIISTKQHVKCLRLSVYQCRNASNKHRLQKLSPIIFYLLCVFPPLPILFSMFFFSFFSSSANSSLGGGQEAIQFPWDSSTSFLLQQLFVYLNDQNIENQKFRAPFRTVLKPWQSMHLCIFKYTDMNNEHDWSHYFSFLFLQDNQQPLSLALSVSMKSPSFCPVWYKLSSPSSQYIRRLAKTLLIINY